MKNSDQIKEQSFSERTGRNYDVLVYGDVNLGIMDGSAVWLVSLAEALSVIDVNVHVLLKVVPENDRLIRRLAHLDNVTIHEPYEDEYSNRPLSYLDLGKKLQELDERLSPHAIIVRGRAACASAIETDNVAKKLWAYVTDLPHPAERLKPSDLSTLTHIANSCRRMFAQTPDAQAYLEAIIPAAAGKTVLLNPMVPDEFFVDLDNHSVQTDSQNIRLIYSGKFKPEWRTYEMCELPDAAQRRGLQVKLTMLGDKFQAPRHDPEWETLMRDALENTNVNWRGGMTREESVREMQNSTFGLSWRDESLDTSLELSTKVLEYAAAGAPPILNRTPAHEQLFGEDYPLFIEEDNPEAVIDTLESVHNRFAELQQRAQRAAKKFSVSSSAIRIKELFDRTYKENKFSPEDPTRVLLAGHDLKFVGELTDSFSTSPNISLDYDEWHTLHSHDLEQSLSKLEKADIVFCEWAGKNAVWYSKNKRASQKLFVRLHGFEARANWLIDIEVDQVDAIIVVSEHMKQRILARTDWPASKIHVIPNSIDSFDLNREKVTDHEYRIGLVGIVPFLKRPDRALEFFKYLLQWDNRYTLHIRGRFPWEYSHIWKKATSQEQYLDFFQTIGSDPKLYQRIIFEPFGADMASWYRKIGYILSPSDDESFHLAPAEAMVSGTAPIIWDREGAEEVFGSEFVVQDSREAAERVIQLNGSNENSSSYQSLAASKAASWDASIVNQQIFKLLFHS